MKISVTVSNQQEFSVGMWWAKTPDFVVATLCEQLEAAQVIWPELKEYKLEKRRAHSVKKTKVTGGGDE